MSILSFKKLNAIKKFQLKVSDKVAYKKYKYELNQYNLYLKRKGAIKTLQDQHKLFNPTTLKKLALQNGSLSFSHSGNSGDIIYALSTLKAISVLIEKPVNLYLTINQPRKAHPTYIHPLGMVMMNQNMAQMLIPLIKEQLYINDCNIFQHQEIDINLDNIRNVGFNLDKGNITKWYNYLTGVHADTINPWLNIGNTESLNNRIIIARSERYRNLFIDYSFLKKYPNLLFVGLNNEFEDMKKSIPNLEWQPVDNFLQLTEIIAGCKLFIGNQSFPFAIAEGLKVPRILEKDYEEPNVIPEGDAGFDYYFQEHFEYLVANIVNSK